MSTSPLQPIATLRLHDLDSSDDALVIIRASPERVAIALSLKRDGDLEVCLSARDAQEILKALHAALANATQA